MGSNPILSATRRSEGAQGDLPELQRSAGRRIVWYVYFLELASGDIYVGSTNDLKRRFASHQKAQVISTRRHLPVQLKSYVAVETESHARELELYFKSGSGKAIALRRLVRRGEPIAAGATKPTQ